MADPLATLAEREVPERTNYFDPAAAQTVISRYASARRRSDSSGELAESAARLSRFQQDEDRAARDRVMQGREDEEYQARKEALAQQGELLTTLNDIDTEAPDYDRKVTEFMTSLPPELHEEPAVKSIFAFKNQVADDARRRRDAETTKKQSFDNQMAMFRERAKHNAALKGITDEDVKAATLPDGSVDMLALGMKAASRERGYKASEFDRRLKAVNEGRVQVVKDIDLSRRGRERRTSVGKFVVEDRAAFPPRFVNAVTQDYMKATGKSEVNPTALEVSPEWGPKLKEAMKKDSNPLENELSAAFRYDDPDEYVGLVPGLTESQKERRRMVWEHAHRDGGVEEMEAPTESPAAAAPTGAAKKVLTPEVIADFKKRAGGDPAKAKQMALDEGY